MNNTTKITDLNSEQLLQLLFLVKENVHDLRWIHLTESKKLDFISQRYEALRKLENDKTNPINNELLQQLENDKTNPINIHFDWRKIKHNIKDESVTSTKINVQDLYKTYEIPKGYFDNEFKAFLDNNATYRIVEEDDTNTIKILIMDSKCSRGEIDAHIVERFLAQNFKQNI